ncbi:hypothetical protein ACVME8_000355 [Bradyrhizobium diazoefficiens]
MSNLEKTVIGEGAGRIARNRIDEIIAGRFACREFSDTPVPRRTIEQILGVARFAPSGANIQPWHVYESWPRLFGQRPAGFKWIPAGLC